MAIITERRWKCDYCGNVSPVLEQNPEWHNWPFGWVSHYTGFADVTEDNHIPVFCCQAHKDAWLDDRSRPEGVPA